MSSFLYGRMQAKREESTKKGASKTTAPPGVSTYADILTALVPAEVLAAAVFFVSQFSETKKDATTGKDVVTITHPHELKLAFFGCAIAAVVIFIAGHAQGGKKFKDNWDRWDFLRMLIPALAFAGWAMAQKPATMFDVTIGLGDATKVLLIVGGAFVLGGAAALLGMKADAKNAT